MDPRARAIEQARHYKELSGEHFRRTLRATRTTMRIVGALLLLLASAFAAMLVPAARAGVVGPAVPAAVFAILLPTFAIFGALCLIVASKYAPPSAALLAEGEPGRATLREVRGAALSVTTHSGTITRSALILDVDLPGSAPYRVVHRMFVPHDYVPMLRRGATLAVRVDRDKPARLVVDWEATREIAT